MRPAIGQAKHGVLIMEHFINMVVILVGIIQKRQEHIALAVIFHQHVENNFRRRFAFRFGNLGNAVFALWLVIRHTVLHQPEHIVEAQRDEGANAITARQAATLLGVVFLHEIRRAVNQAFANFRVAQIFKPFFGRQVGQRQIFRMQ